MAGARTRRIRRIAASTELGELVEKLGLQGDAYDRNWWSRHDSREDRTLWLATPVGHGNREESAVDDSNYEVAETILTDASSFGEVSTRYDAWPGGLIETLLVRADDAPALRELARIIDALESYPILDDEHHSEMEWDRAHPSDHECYADDQCGCEVRNHDHAGEGFSAEYADEDGEVFCDLCREYVRPGTRVVYGELEDEDER
jgi:hypothetical protein